MRIPSAPLVAVIAENLQRRLASLGTTATTLSRTTALYGARVDRSVLSRLLRSKDEERPDGKARPELSVSQLIALARSLDTTPAHLVTPRVGRIELIAGERGVNKFVFRDFWRGHRLFDGSSLDDPETSVAVVCEDVNAAYEYAITRGGYLAFKHVAARIELALERWEDWAAKNDPLGPQVYKEQRRQAVAVRTTRERADHDSASTPKA